MFFITADDLYLSKTFKREANIVLASLEKDGFVYITLKNKFTRILKTIQAIESTGANSNADVNEIIETIKMIIDDGIMSPLTLENDEFDFNSDIDGKRYNLRYPDIYAEKSTGRIFNANAFNVYIRAVYSDILKEQIDAAPTIHKKNRPVYISKGGVITGDYILDCQIRPEVVAKHKFTIQSIVNIPVCLINYKGGSIYVVDHRDPKLKNLMEFYDCVVSHDDEVAKAKLNIRNYKKL
jgi:hypothetical protein